MKKVKEKEIERERRRGRGRRSVFDGVALGLKNKTEQDILENAGRM